MSRPETPRSTPRSEAFPLRLSPVLGDLDRAGDVLGRPEAVNPLQKRGDLQGAYIDRVEVKDGFGKLERGPLSNKKESGNGNCLSARGEL